MNTRLFHWRFFGLFGITLLASCGQNSASFSGSTGTRPGPLPVNQTKEAEVVSFQVTDRFYGSEKKKSEKTDLFFLVDTSGSMQEEIGFLQKAMQDFFFELVNLGIEDYQVFMVGRSNTYPFDFPDEVKNNPHFARINTFINSGQPFAVLNKVLNDPNDTTLKIRPDSKKHVIIVTDDNDHMIPDDFIKTMTSSSNGTPENLILHGIVGLQLGRNSDTCTIDHIGNAYIDASKMLPNKGLIQDICKSDWSDLLTNLANYIVSKVTTQTFKLSRPLEKGDEIKVAINGSRVPPDNYSVDFNRNELTFKDGLAPQDGASIEVTYTAQKSP